MRKEGQLGCCFGHAQFFVNEYSGNHYFIKKYEKKERITPEYTLTIVVYARVYVYKRNTDILYSVSNGHKRIIQINILSILATRGQKGALVGHGLVTTTGHGSTHYLQSPVAPSQAPVQQPASSLTLWKSPSVSCSPSPDPQPSSFGPVQGMSQRQPAWPQRPQRAFSSTPPDLGCPPTP